MTTPSAYLTDPESITRASFALLREEAGIDRLPLARRAMATRIVHACAMPEIAARLSWSGDPTVAGRQALGRDAPILVDSRMLAAGISAPPGSAPPRVICRVAASGVAQRAREQNMTRSAAAVDLWREDLDGAVVAIGNAPTALFRLLENLAVWNERPAVILAFPVGFIGAAESKQALMEAEIDLPYVTLPGRLGGTAMAAAAVNTLLRPLA